jgi:hypothetical protein
VLHDAHVPHLPARPEHAIDATAPFSSQAPCQADDARLERARKPFKNEYLRCYAEPAIAIGGHADMRVYDEIISGR